MFTTKQWHVTTQRPPSKIKSGACLLWAHIPYGPDLDIKGSFGNILSGGHALATHSTPIPTFCPVATSL